MIHPIPEDGVEEDGVEEDGVEETKLKMSSSSIHIAAERTSIFVTGLRAALNSGYSRSYIT